MLLVLADEQIIIIKKQVWCDTAIYCNAVYSAIYFYESNPKAAHIHRLS